MRSRAFALSSAACGFPKCLPLSDVLEARAHSRSRFFLPWLWGDAGLGARRSGVSVAAPREGLRLLFHSEV